LQGLARGGSHQFLREESVTTFIWAAQASIPGRRAETGGKPDADPGDIAAQIGALPGNSFDAILHDPPRFGTPESFTRKPSTTNWRECSSATANYSTTPAPRNKTDQRPERSNEVAETTAARGISPRSEWAMEVAVKK